MTAYAIETLDDLAHRIKNEVFVRLQAVEQYRARDNAAAIAIQRSWRGYHVRQSLKEAQIASVCIQRHYRGYATRKRMIEFREAVYRTWCLKQYNQHARKIQCAWRGYYSRQHNFDFYARKRYFEQLQRQNEIVRNYLANYSAQLANAEEERKHRRMLDEMNAFVSRYNVCISTNTLPGIYYKNTMMENMLREIRRRHAKSLAKEAKQKRRAAKENSNHPAEASGDGISFFPVNTNAPPSSEPVWLDKLISLTTKPQGPFREPAQVLRQRYRAPNTSLLASTPFHERHQQLDPDPEFSSKTKSDTLGRPAFHIEPQLDEEPYDMSLNREIPFKDTKPKYAGLWRGNLHDPNAWRDPDHDFKRIFEHTDHFDKFGTAYTHGFTT